MKLIDLLEAIGEGYCSFDTAEIIQICEPNMDWDNFLNFMWVRSCSSHLQILKLILSVRLRKM